MPKYAICAARVVRVFTLLCLAAFCALATGCVGGKVPSEQILRITQGAASPGTRAQAEALNAAPAVAARPLLVMDDLAAFPALDRSAVMLAHGRVLTPSTRWYWEGAPAAITSASIAAALQGMPEFTIVWPYRNRMEHQGMLTGRVEAFEARPDSREMYVSVRMSLWTPRGRQLLDTQLVQATQPLASVSAQGIADAAGRCMAQITTGVAEWLRTGGLKALNSHAQESAE